jgi:ribonuclease P protein component
MTEPGGEGFPKTARVRRRREYLAIGRTARRRHTAHFVVLSETRRTGSARLGVTVSRKVGGAVTRNYVKRCVRETFRRRLRSLAAGRDLVVIARPGAGDLDFEAIAGELHAAIAAEAERSART